MRSRRFLLLALLGSVPVHVQAMSKPFDATAGVVLKSGEPCFYSQVVLPPNPPDYLKDLGVGLNVFNEKVGSKGYVWYVWFKSWTTVLPTSPTTCIPYGISSPDVVKKQATPLPKNTPFSFEMTGGYGHYAVDFCVRADNQHHNYLSTVVWNSGIAECTNELLKNKRP